MGQKVEVDLMFGNVTEERLNEIYIFYPYDKIKKCINNSFVKKAHCSLEEQ